MFITLQGEATQSVTFGVYENASGVGTIALKFSSVVDAGDDALLVRNALMPEIGIGEAFKRVRVNGMPAIRISDAGFSLRQTWVSDGVPAVLLEPSVPVTLSGITFTAIEPGTSGAGQASSVPAAGDVGLGMLIATLMAAGGWVISRLTGFTRTA